MIVVGLAAAVWIVGLLVFALSTNPKTERIGIVMFAVGLLAFLLMSGTIKIP